MIPQISKRSVHAFLRENPNRSFGFSELRKVFKANREDAAGRLRGILDKLRREERIMSWVGSRDGPCVPEGQEADLHVIVVMGVL